METTAISSFKAFGYGAAAFFMALPVMVLIYLLMF